MYPKGQPAERFRRWRFVWWLLFYVEDALSRLPMLLLGPTMGAVIGTAIAVSELSSITIDGKVAATVPSVWDVLLPALLGGVGGIVVLTLLSAIWGLVSYFLLDGDDVWAATMPGQGAVELVCRRDVPVGVEWRGATRRPLRSALGSLPFAQDSRCYSEWEIRLERSETSWVNL